MFTSPLGARGSASPTVQVLMDARRISRRRRNPGGSTARPDLRSHAAGRQSPASLRLQPYPSLASGLTQRPPNTRRKPRGSTALGGEGDARSSLPPPAPHSPLQGEVLFVTAPLVTRRVPWWVFMGPPTALKVFL